LTDGDEDKDHQQNDYRDHNNKYAEAYFFSIIYCYRGPIISEVCSDIHSTLAPQLLLRRGIMLEQ
jgi:hypothetical protein